MTQPWSQRTQKHYPIAADQLRVLIEHASEAPFTKASLLQHVASGDFAKIEQEFATLNGKTLSVEGIFAALPTMLRQASLGDLEIEWFGKVAAFYNNAVDILAAQAVPSSEAIRLVPQLSAKAEAMQKILKNVQQTEINPPR